MAEFARLPPGTADKAATFARMATAKLRALAGRPFDHADGRGRRRSAFAGQMATHAAHETQSRGRISHGVGPAMARQWTGQTAAQSPQPVQSEGLRMGRSRIVFACGLPHDSADGRGEKAGRQVFAKVSYAWQH